MWIADYITQSSLKPRAAEQGEIKGSLDGLVEVSASSSFSKIPVVSPYGVAFVPPAGEKAVVINSNGSPACLGTINQANGLLPGELLLFSKGGASIRLCNDGKVYINGREFS